MKKSDEYRQRIAALASSMREITDNPEGEGGGLSADQETKWENLNSEVDRLKDLVTKAEATEAIEASLNRPGDPQPQNAPRPVPGATPEGEGGSEPDQAQAYHEAFFQGFVRHGRAGLSPEFRNALEVGTNSEGGYLVPESWEAELIRALAEINVVRKYARATSLSTTTNLPVQTSRGTFTWIDEEGTYSENDPAYGNVQIGAFKVGGIIKVSEELLQDSMVNVAAELNRDATDEFALREEAAFIDGDGTLKPTGLFQTASVASVSLQGVTAASATTVTADEIIDTFYTLGRRYRGNAVWVTSDAMAKIIRKLKDADNQYLWAPGLTAGEPDTLLGRPFETSDAVPAVATSNRTIMLGDFGYYRIADRLGTTAQRLDELYAATGLVGFRFKRRVDAKLTLAPAFTYLEQA